MPQCSMWLPLHACVPLEKQIPTVVLRGWVFRNIEDDPQYHFKFPDPETVAPPVLGFNDVAFGYSGGPQLFHDLNFGIDMGSRFAMVGPNGTILPWVTPLAWHVVWVQW